MRLTGLFQLPSLPCSHPTSHCPVQDALEGPDHPKSPRTQPEAGEGPFKNQSHVLEMLGSGQLPASLLLQLLGVTFFEPQHLS